LSTRAIISGKTPIPEIPISQNPQGKKPCTRRQQRGAEWVVVQAEKQNDQGVPLRLVEYGQEIGTAHNHQGVGTGHDVYEVDDGWHHAAKLEQRVKGQHQRISDRNNRSGIFWIK
jgi:hypothetical protein